MQAHTNRLAQESSPYLLQHAHNPVDWYPWGDEAFEKAKKEDKPVLVSIGYAACHWCHVMERESFEDHDVASIMNEHFINIKVDREERPDVDHIYMDAVQAITGSGGWPLNVFLTPDKQPFYGGTYFPPRRAFNRASWTEVLNSLSKAYKERKDKVIADAELLTEHLKKSNAFGVGTGQNASFSKEIIGAAFKNVMKNADEEWGGFGQAPKFPQTFVITFLLRYHFLTGNQQAKQQALLSLDKMMQGGLYDHIGGGFARYSTDTQWLVPHFEKMLYDNALLVWTLTEAYALTGERNPEVLEETLQFIDRELTHPGGGFYAALDADSEGEEGRFYVWSYKEVQEILGTDAQIFCTYFDITPQGNWEGKNIPHITKPLSLFASENNVKKKEVQTIINQGKQKLLLQRNKRIRPQLDDKILLGWNALMNIGYSRAYASTGNQQYREIAIRNMNFLFEHLSSDQVVFLHTWKDGNAKHPAFLDDYSYLIAALIELATITADYSWLRKAEKLTETVLNHFGDKQTPFFFFTPDFQSDVLLRKKEVYDGATPSGNAIMAGNLYRLSILLGKPRWRQESEQMLASLGEVISSYPTSFGVWLHLVTEIVYGTAEIAIVGERAKEVAAEILQLYLPHKVVMASRKPDYGFPLFFEKKNSPETLIFLCENYACRQPVRTVNELKLLINQNNLNQMQYF